MKSNTPVFATLLIAAAFLLMQAILPNAALAATGWTNTNGGVSGYQIDSLAYDSVHNLLYAGTSGALGTGNGVWKWNGSKWTNTGSGMSGQEEFSLAYDSVDNLLYAGCVDPSKQKD